jgi:drug/metabolite transporter (DMT)-like permease
VAARGCASPRDRRRRGRLGLSSIDGLLLAVVSSIAWALLDGANKLLGRHLSALVTVGVVYGLTSLLLFGVATIEGGGPAPDGIFFAAVAGAATINIVCSLLYMRAVQISPLSLTIPYLAFTPVVLLFTAWIMIGEFPGVRGVVGVLTVALGAYLLNRGDGTPGGPLRALAKEAGSRMMLAVALMWGVSASLDKVGILHGPPVLYAAMVYSGIAVPILIFTLLRSRASFAALKDRRVLTWVAIAAIVTTFAYTTQLISLRGLYVSYVIAIKRSGLLLSVLIGHFAFREGELEKRLPGAAVMVLGVLLIVLR